MCLSTAAAADNINHGGGGHSRASLRGRGPGPDSGLHRLPLPAAGGHDHPLCQGDHGPLQCNTHLHMGGTAPGRLTHLNIHMHTMYNVRSSAQPYITKPAKSPPRKRVVLQGFCSETVIVYETIMIPQSISLPKKTSKQTTW